MEKNGIAIDIRQLHRWFGDNHVLSGIDLKIPAGTATAIVGGSGAGKSVLLKHMVGLLMPDSGSIYIFNHEMPRKAGRELEEIRRRFAMVFQGSALLNSLTVGQNVALGLVEQRKLSPAEIDRIIREKLALVGLKGKESRRPGELSGGMRKRVAIARALAMDPEIILFDEPTSGLDPVMAENIDSLIADLRDRLKKTVVIVTHDMDSAFKIADGICMLYEGKIIEQGSPETFRSSTNPIVEQFISRFKRHNDRRIEINREIGPQKELLDL
ncbi:MAG TPA: ABC transporter ATP-binding protein [Candidatus Hypogeohydataceae bacterium YC41]